VSGGIGIDWKSATVRDGRLTVALDDSAPKGWVAEVNDVVERLARSGHSWGDVKASKKKLAVSDVQPGAEESLRHFLESALLQANRDLEAAGDDDEDDGGDEELSDTDRRMTEAFRAFAEAG
jgi:hypothetical protein